MADIQKTIAVIFQARDELSQKVKELDKVLEGLGGTSGDSKVKVDGLGTSLDDIGGSAPGINAASVAMKALAASLVAKDFLDANLAFEKFNKAMTVATGDSKLAAAEYEFVRSTSERLGVEVRSTGDAYATFANSVKGSALEGEGARKIFEGFVGAMSRVGASSADISGAFVQLAQGISKGKFELEDLKSIAERVPGFFKSMADSLGISTQALFDLISAGKIGGPEILKFADTVSQSFKPEQFEGFTNSLARLRNTINDTFVDIGKAGAFDVLIKGVEGTTAVLTGSISAIKLFGELIGNFFYLLSTANKGDYGIFSADWKGFGDNAKAALDKAASSTKDLRDIFDGTSDSAGTATTVITRGMTDAEKATAATAKATADVDALLKRLGVNPTKIKAEFAEIAEAIKSLFENPETSGAQALAGLEAALKRVKNSGELNAIGESLTQAFISGKLSADQFSEATGRLGDVNQKLMRDLNGGKRAVDEQSEALNKAAKEAEKAQERAEKFRLEMEKLASNERIKNIEARVTLDVANIQEQTKRVQAAFESLDNTVTNTGEALSDLFKLFASDNLSFSALSDIRDQIDLENKRRDEALRLQGELTRAQIEQIRAQTKSMNRGDALIKIDGAGLQPHLEAFMWEILKAVQVRVNAQGLSLLLGV